jgi:hypothetical protein
LLRANETCEQWNSNSGVVMELNNLQHADLAEMTRPATDLVFDEK